jgi:AcrR family transcriptional regulator
MPYPGLVPRETLTRDQIVQAAIELLDADGLDGLSMRRLGNRLGSAATAVYWHVKSKDDLVVLAGDQVWGEITLPDPDVVGWRAAATTMANDTYGMLTRHLWLVSAMSTVTVYGPGKARYDDHCIAVFNAAGFTGMDIDRAMNAVFTYVLGNAVGSAAEAAWRARLRRDGGSEEEGIRDAITWASEIAVQFPRLRAHGEALGDVDIAAAPEQTFAFGLQAILDGLEVQLADRHTAAG